MKKKTDLYTVDILVDKRIVSMATVSAESKEEATKAMLPKITFSAKKLIKKE